MFNLEDMTLFFLSLLVILPLITMIHQAGHAFFAWIFGGKITFTIGAGKKLFALGPVEVRRIYFWHSFCQYEKLKHDTKIAHILVFLGGSLFNAGSIILINSLILTGMFEPHIFFYQFVYFSVYYMFFALFPARYSEDHPSDMMAVYDLLKYGKSKDPLD
ncbi:hypothetical protein JSY36_07310 [Bacillus sp. H-16]|uniref:hypothetical protein n=1 Tax=Alteribacter salitolerans TaxID=2912333 RepID=UPI0019659907|nr:hypothetical protein [Alteribacter salitolerans]